MTGDETKNLKATKDHGDEGMMMMSEFTNGNCKYKLSVHAEERKKRDR